MKKTGGKDLAKGVLEKAMIDYCRFYAKDFESVKRWFEDKSREPMGFYWCLEYSEVNPNLVRKYLGRVDDMIIETNIIMDYLLHKFPKIKEKKYRANVISYLTEKKGL